MTASEPLSFEVALEILRPAFPDDSLILVGGQAVSYWLTYYRKREEELAGLVGVTSDDVDFLGDGNAAERFAKAVHGALRKATMDDPGPSTATVTVTDSSGASRTIDFLASVHGLLDTRRVRNTAIPIEPLNIRGEPSGIEIRVMHPVLCLASRVHNAHSFPRYRSERALRQLRAAIGCARAYIRDCCDRDDVRAAHDAIRTIAELASNDAGKFVHANLAFDALDAIPLDERLGREFLERNLPRIRKRAGRPPPE